MTPAEEVIAQVFGDYLEQARWVEWRPKPKPGGGEKKVPYIAGDDPPRAGSATEPEKWRPFALCRGERRGVVFNGDGLWGWDLDGCRNPETGALAPWAQQVIAAADTYCEVSPSGTGVKGYALGALPAFTFKRRKMPGEPVNGKQPGIEAYANGRYFAVTGKHLPGTPLELRQLAPAQWVASLLPVPSGRHRRLRNADDSRHHALFNLAYQLQRDGVAEDDLRAAVHAANRADNAALHPEFAEKGAKDAREVDNMLRWVLRKVEPDNRTVLVLRAGELHKQADAAENALTTTGRVFRQDNRLVCCGYEEADATKGRRVAVARIRAYNAVWLQCELSETVRCVKHTEQNEDHEITEVTADVPKPLAEAVLARASHKFSDLAGIIETPTLRPDGSLLTRRGYDPATGLMLFGSLTVSVPERPTRAEAEAALALLNGLLLEFPFVDAASRSVALSALITPVVRPAMAFAPLHEFVAPEPRTGKSYLVDLSAGIATGRACPVIGAADTNRGGVDREELDKKLVGALLAGQALIFLDNIEGSLGSSLLSQMMTQSRLQLRVLGKTGNPEVANVATVFATGNNMEVAGDLIARTVRCGLDAQMENPGARTFKHDPFRTIVADRGKYITAALTLVRAHLVAGCPGAEGLPPVRGFDDWSRLVRAALVWLRCADPVTTQEQLRVTDPRAAPLDELMEVWADALNDGKVRDAWLTAKELVNCNWGPLEQALREATHARDIEPPNALKVGNFFKKNADRVRKEMKLAANYDSHAKQQRWRLLYWREFLATRAAARAAEAAAAAEAAGAQPATTVVTLPPPGQRSVGRKAVRKRPQE